MHNVLSNIVAHVATDSDGPITPASVISQSLVTTDRVYSYLVYAEYSDHRLSGWRVEFVISQVDDYNTIHKAQAILDICALIDESYNRSQQSYVIGYKQPPLDLLLQVLDPLVQRLARQQHDYWGLEYDDLCQTCRLVICALYRKGYYIHKSLVNRAFINEVLMSIRKERYKPQMVSIDQPVAYDKEGKAFTLEAEGLLARVIQHEYDHLEGRLFTDRLEKGEREKLLARYEKQASKARRKGRK